MSESAKLLDAYLTRVAQHEASGRKLPLQPGVMTADGVKSWRESANPGRGLARARNGKPAFEQIEGESITDNVDWGLDPIRRRSSADRLAEATKRIYDEALASYQQTGKVLFPASILRDIQEQFWREGETITIEQIEQLAEHEIRPLCERYAAKLLQIAQRQNPGNEKHVMTPEISTK